MAKIYEGKLVGKSFKIGIVVSRFNDFITKKLLEGALDILNRHEVKEGDIEIAWVPGSFEIPLVAKKMANTKKYDGIICLGALIKGATTHFEYIASECAKGIAQIGLETGRPIIFGVLTCDTLEEAIERAGSKAGNKGSESARTVLEMINLIREIK